MGAAYLTTWNGEFFIFKYRNSPFYFKVARRWDNITQEILTVAFVSLSSDDLPKINCVCRLGIFSHTSILYSVLIFTRNASDSNRTYFNILRDVMATTPLRYQNLHKICEWNEVYIYLYGIWELREAIVKKIEKYKPSNITLDSKSFFISNYMCFDMTLVVTFFYRMRATCIHIQAEWAIAI